MSKFSCRNSKTLTLKAGEHSIDDDDDGALRYGERAASSWNCIAFVELGSQESGFGGERC